MRCGTSQKVKNINSKLRDWVISVISYIISTNQSLQVWDNYKYTVSSQVQQYANDMHKSASTSFLLNISSLMNSSNLTPCGKLVKL
jgi:hypothetical protein